MTVAHRFCVRLAPDAGEVEGGTHDRAEQARQGLAASSLDLACTAIAWTFLKVSARRRLYAIGQRFVTTSIAVVRGEEARQRPSGRRVPMEEEGALGHFTDHLTEVTFICRNLELPTREEIVEDRFDELDLGGPAPVDGRGTNSGPSRNGRDRCRLEAIFDQRLPNGSENNRLH